MSTSADSLIDQYRDLMSGGAPIAHVSHERILAPRRDGHEHFAPGPFGNTAGELEDLEARRAAYAEIVDAHSSEWGIRDAANIDDARALIEEVAAALDSARAAESEAALRLAEATESMTKIDPRKNSKSWKSAREQIAELTAAHQHSIADLARACWSTPLAAAVLASQIRIAAAAIRNAEIEKQANLTAAVEALYQKFVADVAALASAQFGQTLTDSSDPVFEYFAQPFGERVASNLVNAAIRHLGYLPRSPEAAE
jgi:hypothetical protein